MPEKGDLRFNNQGRWEVFKDGRWQAIIDTSMLERLQPYIGWRKVDGEQQLLRRDGTWTSRVPVKPTTPEGEAPLDEGPGSTEGDLIGGNFDRAVATFHAERNVANLEFSVKLNTDAKQIKQLQEWWLEAFNAGWTGAASVYETALGDFGEQPKRPQFPTLETGFEKQFRLDIRSWLMERGVAPETITHLMGDSEFIADMKTRFETANLQVEPGQPFIETTDFLGDSLAPFASIVDEALTRQITEPLEIGQAARNKAFLDAPESALAQAIMDAGWPERNAWRVAEQLAPALVNLFKRASAEAIQAGQKEPLRFEDIVPQFVSALSREQIIEALEVSVAEENRRQGHLSADEVADLVRRQEELNKQVELKRQQEIEAQRRAAPPVEQVLQALRFNPQFEGESEDRLREVAGFLAPMFIQDYNQQLGEAQARGEEGIDFEEFVLQQLEQPLPPIPGTRDLALRQKAGEGRAGVFDVDPVTGTLAPRRTIFDPGTGQVTGFESAVRPPFSTGLAGEPPLATLEEQREWLTSQGWIERSPTYPLGTLEQAAVDLENKRRQEAGLQAFGPPVVAGLKGPTTEEFGQAAGRIAGDEGLFEAFVKGQRPELEKLFGTAQRRELEEKEERLFKAVLSPATAELATVGGLTQGAKFQVPGITTRPTVFESQGLPGIEPGLVEQAQKLARTARPTRTIESFLEQERPRLRGLFEASPQFRQRRQQERRRSLFRTPRTRVHVPV